MFVNYFKSEDQNAINNFLNKSSFSYIQQSPQWTEFQGTLPSRISAETIIISNNKDYLSSIILSCSYTIIKTVFNKNYLHINKGPVFQNNFLKNDNKIKILNTLHSELVKSAKQNNCIFIRYDFPFTNDIDKSINAFYKKFKKAHTTFNPKRTLMLELDKTEEELLKDMRPKGRYNIKVARKKGIEVTISENIKDIDHFYNILQTTASRDGFSVHNQEFYKKMFKSLSKTKLCKIYLAKYNNEVIAANIVTFFADKVTYYYGASSNKFRNLMAPYLLQWTAILDAKKTGYKYYDFLGIAENDKPKHSWAGITSFKRKFGGFDIDYAISREIILKPFLYYIMIFAKKILKKLHL